jgi:hypothetical protein
MRCITSGVVYGVDTSVRWRMMMLIHEEGEELVKASRK